MTQTDKKHIMEQEMKNNDQTEENDICYDINILKISNWVKSKRNSHSNVAGLKRIFAKNTKFTSFNKQHELHNDDNDNPKKPLELYDYSFGVTYFYWKHYKNSTSIYDDADPQQNSQRPHQPIAANNNSTVGEWYITKKYTTFKEELTSNEIYTIAKQQFDQLVIKAQAHIQTNHVRRRCCARHPNTAMYFEMKTGDLMRPTHLIALMAYCNYEVFASRFCETYRKIKHNETLQEMKNRHRNYYFLGRLLRECVQCFGLQNPNPNRKNQRFTFNLFRGVNQYFMFESLYAYIKSPLSTTMDISVAVGFCENEGMILDLVFYTHEWRYCADVHRHGDDPISCFECNWISAFTNEQEILCIGGMHQFLINTIIEVSTGKNYIRYINGLKQMTHTMTNGEHQTPLTLKAFKAVTRDEQQMVFRLLSHELYRYDPDNERAHEFKSCPEYFRTLLHNHCLKIKNFYVYEDPGGVTDLFFTYDNGWIKLELIMTLFPNIEEIAIAFWSNITAIDCKCCDITFLKDPFIFESVLKFAKQNEETKLKRITVTFGKKNEDEMLNYIEQYRRAFTGLWWECFTDVWKGMERGAMLCFENQRSARVHNSFVGSV